MANIKESQFSDLWGVAFCVVSTVDIFHLLLPASIVYAQKNEPFPKTGCHIDITERKEGARFGD